jgi:hypothetical protein
MCFSVYVTYSVIDAVSLTNQQNICYNITYMCVLQMQPLYKLHFLNVYVHDVNTAAAAAAAAACTAESVLHAALCIEAY